MWAVSDKSVVDDGSKLVVVSRADVTEKYDETDSYRTESNIGYMAKQMTRLNVEYEEDYGVTVDMKYYNGGLFTDKMRLKMLAGDNDYDVVLLEGDTTLLPQILKYDLYMHLENYDNITGGFDKLIDGLDELMTYNGHLFGIPYVVKGNIFAVNDNSDKAKYGFDFENGITNEEFWSTLESSECVIRADDILAALLISVIEDGAQNDRLSKETILEQINNVMKYLNNNALTVNYDNNTYMSVVSFGGEQFLHGGLTNYSGYDELMAVPTYNGKNYYAVYDSMYINSVTTKPEAAVNYLASYFENDFQSYHVRYCKTFLAKDVSSYFRFTNDKIVGIAESGLENGYESVRYPYDIDHKGTFDDNYSLGVEQGGRLFKNSAIRMYTLGMEDYIEDFVKQVTSGSITPEDAAEQLYNEFAYRIFE